MCIFAAHFDAEPTEALQVMMLGSEPQSRKGG